VLLHCAGGVSRTPTIAAAYLTDLTGMSGTEALTEVAGVTGTRPWNPRFVEVLEQVEAAT
jgi:protein-tyrosine phosphatase